MKQTYTLICLIALSLVSIGQNEKPDFQKKVIKNVSDFGKIGPLRDIIEKPVKRRKKHKVIYRGCIYRRFSYL